MSSATAACSSGCGDKLPTLSTLRTVGERGALEQVALAQAQVLVLLRLPVLLGDRRVDAAVRPALVELSAVVEEDGDEAVLFKALVGQAPDKANRQYFTFFLKYCRNEEVFFLTLPHRQRQISLIRL